MKKHRLASHEFVRKFFIDNPDATVDQAAKAASNARLKAYRSEVADIRRQLEPVIKAVPVHPSAPHVMRVEAPARQKRLAIPPHPMSAPLVRFDRKVTKYDTDGEPLVRVETTPMDLDDMPRWTDGDMPLRVTTVTGDTEDGLPVDLGPIVIAATQDGTTAPSPAPEVVEVDEDEDEEEEDSLPPPPGFPLSTMSERRRFLNELAEADPGINPTIARARVIEKYGRGVASEYLYDTLRVARELHYLPPISKKTRRRMSPAPVVAPPTPAAPVVPDNGERLLTYTNKDNQPKLVGVKKDEVSKTVFRLLMEGVKPEHIKLWKSAPLAINFNVDAG